MRCGPSPHGVLVLGVTAAAVAPAAADATAALSAVSCCATRLGRGVGRRGLAEVARQQQLVGLPRSSAAGRCAASLGRATARRRGRRRRARARRAARRAAPRSRSSRRVVADDRQQPLDDDRREAEAQLVQQQQLRLARQRPADREHLLLAAGQQPGRRSAQLAQRREVRRTRRRRRGARRVRRAGSARPRSARRRCRDPRARARRPCGRRALALMLARVLPVDRDRARPSACTMPEMARSVVVLPAPLAPSSATTSPGATVRSRSRTTGAPS